MNSTEAIFFWMTTLTTAVAFFFGLISVVLKKNQGLKFAQYNLLLSFFLLTVFGVIRWTITSHPPFVTLFESMITSIWFVFLIYLIISKFLRRNSILLLPVTLISMLMLGWSSSLPADPSPLSASLDSTWLFIHASFATAGAAAFIIASSFSFVYLMGESRLDNLGIMTEKFPAFNTLPRTILNFVIFGLILWGVMIVSGSIWAHVAWGRYWAWDPIELWSLISWLLYGLVLHSRIGLKISNRTFCWLTIIAALTVIFALWGVSYVYETIHVYG